MDNIYKMDADVLMAMPDKDFMVILKVCYLDAIMRERVYVKLPENMKHYFKLVEGEQS